MLSFFDCFEINSLFLGYFIFSVNTPLNMCNLICSRAWSGETWIGKQCLELSKTLTNEVLTQYWIQFLILFRVWTPLRYRPNPSDNNEKSRSAIKRNHKRQLCLHLPPPLCWTMWKSLPQRTPEERQPVRGRQDQQCSQNEN